mgnify:FL=1|tara:strand:- start:1492 stop:1845 length:354 start_codon:yes stop_codon:yes gene_type:complete
MEIFNKDVSVLGELTLALQNQAGNVVTIDGNGVVKFRTLSELSDDITITSGNADANYVHDQGTPIDVWNIAHNLNKNPSVMVIDSAGTVVSGRIEYIDLNNIKLTFNAPFSGEAFFN